jgi:hypothetical protein
MDAAAATAAVPRAGPAEEPDATPAKPKLNKRWIYLMVAGDFGLAFTWVMVSAFVRRREQ